MEYVLSILAGYLLGSISFSYLAGRLLKGIDIRKHGSGNAGATNTLRVLGKGPGIMVLLLDIAKGVAAVWIGQLVMEANDLGNHWLPVLCGIAVVIGHNWPIFFGFKGGKGIATTIGMVATLAFWPALIAGLTAVAVIAIWRYVSVGSLVFTAMLPILTFFMECGEEVTIAALLMLIFAVWRHRSNLVKLYHGKENKLGAKKNA